MNTRRTVLTRALVSAGALLAMAHSTWAALTITNGNITSNHYTYSLSFSDLNSSTKFNADVYSQSNVSVFQEGSGSGQRNYVRANAGQTSAEFVYRFDFSGTSYRPTNLSVSDYIFVNTGSGTLTETTEYSINGSSWTTVRTKSSSGSAQTSGPGTSNFAISGQPAIVYYRVRYTMSGGTFPTNGGQWARTAPTDPARFAVDITVTPTGGGGGDPSLQVSGNGHYLTDGDGNPVFLAGDTAWMAARRLNRADMVSYLNTRQSQGFNLVMLSSYFAGGSEGINPYGDQPFNFKSGTSTYNVASPITTSGSNPANATEYDYWDHFDYFLTEATNRGIYVGVFPTWGALTMQSGNQQITTGEAYILG